MTVTISGTSGVTFPAGGVGNPAGTVVGTSDSQTLTSKTLTSPTITGAVVSAMASSVLTSGTAVASTSGTSITFSSLPSWIKRVTVMFNGVSLSGTASFLIQIGSGSISTTGYNSSTGYVQSTGTALSGTATTGFILYGVGAANVWSGTVTISAFNSTTYVSTHAFGLVSGGASFGGGISPSLSGALDRVVITTGNGTDTFDAGSINILYE